MIFQIWHFRLLKRLSALAHLGLWLERAFWCILTFCSYYFTLTVLCITIYLSLNLVVVVPCLCSQGKKTIVSENGCVVCHQNFDVSKIINEKGCLQAGEEWIERNVLNISSMGLFITFWQVKQAASSHNYMEEAASDIYIWEHLWHNS